MKIINKSTIIKLIISVILIAWILHKVDLIKLKDILISAKLMWIMGALSLHIYAYWASTKRWQILLDALGIKETIKKLLNSYLVGTFFNQFLPTIVGGDMIRAIDLSDPCKSFTKSLTIILLERFVGIIALLTLVNIGFILRMKYISEVTYWPVYIQFIFIFSIIILFLIGEINTRVVENIIPIKLLKKILHKFILVFNTLVKFRSHPIPLFKVLILSFSLQLIFILHYYFLSISIGVNLSFVFLLIIIPVISLLSMLPVSINGIGLRESLFIYFFSKIGVSPEKSLTICILGFSITLFYGLIGGLIYMSRKEPTNIRDLFKKF